MSNQWTSLSVNCRILLRVKSDAGEFRGHDMQLGETWGRFHVLEIRNPGSGKNGGRTGLSLYS